MRQARAGHDTCGQRVTPRCRWAAGPGQASRRRTERSSRRGRLTGGSPPTGTHSDQAPQVWRAPEGPEGTGGLRDNAPRHTPACQSPPMWRAPEGPVGLAAVPVGGGGAWTAPHSTEGATGVEGVGGTGGPGCGARGRRRGLAGTTQHRRRHRRGGRRRDRRVRAGFETTHRDTHQHASRGRCGGRRRAWLRCPWAVAGPGRASRRRAERSSRRGRLAGGPPPTGTTSSPAQQGAQSARPDSTPRGATRNTAQGRGPAGPRP